MNPYYDLVAARAQNRCEYCRAPEAIFNLPFEVEHIRPAMLGGDNVDHNLALSCRSCNSFKSDRIVGIDEDSNAEARLFNPRVDLWNEHFAFNGESAEIAGLTPVGRATVSRLRMN